MLAGVLIGLLVLVFLVVVHELGHALVARRHGVNVEEFGIGFPPRAWARKLANGVVFSLNWLPLGGFVKLQGEHDADSKPGDYGAASFSGKSLILLAGVVINWLVAALMLTVLAWTGLPKVLPNQFTVPGDTVIIKEPVIAASVSDNSPAERAGLRPGDKILGLNNREVKDPDDLVNLTKRFRGQEVRLVYEHDDKRHSVSVNLRNDNADGQGYLGIGPAQQEKIKTSWSAPVVGLVTTAQFSWVTLQGLGTVTADFFSGLFMQLSPDQSVRDEASKNLSAAGQSVAGPIGILGVIFPAAQAAGLTQIVLLAAIISLTLAIMNVLPIPALDGGRWFVMAIFRLLRKPLSQETEEKIQGIGFTFLMALVVAVTIADVGKLF